MGVGTTGGEEAALDAGFAEAHRRLLADGSIQFELPAWQEPQPPAWLIWLIEQIAAAMPVLKIVFWVVVAGIALLILHQLAVRLAGVDLLRRRKEAAGPDEDWRPAEAPARQLLAEADRLAADGRYAEAAHLLLFRSIEDISHRRPKLVRPALTSRDIARADDIPAPPRRAFGRIVLAVERSLFGGRELGADDWRDCRTAYEEFAFADGWRR
ncbi:MAG: DUF4129 domain-containing protein [Allosphingosinicella sp.]|uniref:DUF4129 domain-containing protein n=1 Tax=Allosphingosinicella sp. TaxID=2823234 RepID=UPI0039255F37